MSCVGIVSLDSARNYIYIEEMCCFILFTKLKILLEKLLHFNNQTGIFIFVATKGNKQNKRKQLIEKVVDENITKCYIDKVASERRSSSLKTERNKQRETSILF